MITISRKLVHLLAVLTVLVSCNPNSKNSSLRLASPVSDNMVLQRNTEVNLWGWADYGQKIRVTTGWNNKTYKSRADADGKWKLSVATGEAGGPYEIKIKADSLITLKNILLGEVWLCSGQSNMEFNLAAAESAKKEVPAASYPEIRLFTVEKSIAMAPRDECFGKWEVCSPETAGSFSAVGYFFGKELYNELNIPIGLINSSWGGTPSEAWTSRERLMEFDELRNYFCELDKNKEQLMSMDKAIYLRDSIQNYIRTQIEGDETIHGIQEGWHIAEYNDSSWPELYNPAEWSATEEIGTLEGICWLRFHLDIPTDWKNNKLILELGPIDEMDETFFNGKRVGSNKIIANWDKDRVYEIPSKLVNSDKAVISIRAINTFNEGGLFGQKEQLKIYPETEPQKAISLAGNWKYNISLRFPELPTQANPQSPSFLYNGMIHPIKNMTIKGAVWYQGEGNASRAWQYRSIFPAMIEDWRYSWGLGNFPFYFVQIAPFRYGQAFINPELREAQFLTLSKVPNTGMAVTMDIGNPEDIHPTNKRDVGKRLALWALAKHYEKDIVYSGPLYKSYKIEGNTIILDFEHAGSGLQAKDGPLFGFEIAGADKIFVEAKARLENNQVIVSAENIKNPTAVRYGWSNTIEPNLFNKEGLPASSFSTEDWARVTKPKN